MIDKETITIAIVDDHALFRQGLISLIERYNESKKYKILFEAGNGLDMGDKIDAGNIPDIVLMDINMPLMDGFSLMQWIHKCYPTINVIAMTMNEDSDAVIRMMKLGAKGYLSKAMHVTDVQNALESVSQKGFYMSDFLSTKLLELVRGQEEETNSKKNAIERLTENEKTFLKLACTELSYAEISQKMKVSYKTIDGYRHTLFETFNVGTRHALIIYAIRNGLVKIN